LGSKLLKFFIIHTAYLSTKRIRACNRKKI
jgi:hypothetical protein